MRTTMETDDAKLETGLAWGSRRTVLGRALALAGFAGLAAGSTADARNKKNRKKRSRGRKNPGSCPTSCPSGQICVDRKCHCPGGLDWGRVAAFGDAGSGIVAAADGFVYVTAAWSDGGVSV